MWPVFSLTVTTRTGSAKGLDLELTRRSGSWPIASSMTPSVFRAGLAKRACSTSVTDVLILSRVTKRASA
ncbi:hypothetical protein BJF92_15500 [Rhizobium rhizosphaerae]|uniref:Uncharacterized protein n=1 Tax=Xaviernesmea rhizosphaerae TaxID=1672749 RepID=A0A1Q9ALW3_9HYPH|nr:hypothetical protein BJF92_15500 [Xaviernesmea rhizosphaerae]